MSKKAALYIRVSTVYQVDKDSLPMQRKDLIAYAHHVLGIDDYDVFEDAGYSGKNVERPAFKEMMRRCRLGEFSHVLVWKIDRISRNLLDFAAMYDELKKLGVSLISKNEQFDTSTPMGEASLKILLVFAELERKTTSERVAATMITRAKEGKWNGANIPYGYEYDKETKYPVLNEKEAEVVKAIFSNYASMRSLVKVVKWLMDNGFQGQEGQQVPEMTPEIVDSITERYIELYENIVGEKFVKGEEGDVLARIEKNITECLAEL